MHLIVSMIWMLHIGVFVAPADAVLGEYWNEEKDGKFAIYKCGEAYCGKIVWRAEVQKDIENPDPKLRDRNIIGVEFIKNFKYQKNKKQWTGGTVYSFDNGNTYKGKMWLENNGETLKMRGYIGVSLIGRTASFERVE